MNKPIEREAPVRAGNPLGLDGVEFIERGQKPVIAAVACKRTPDRGAWAVSTRMQQMDLHIPALHSGVVPPRA